MQEIIAETTEKLQETIAQKEKTQRALDCTRTVLHKTEGERAEQVPIFKNFFCDREYYIQWVRGLQKRNFETWILLSF